MSRFVPAAGPMILLSFGVSRGVELDTLCAGIELAPHQLTDPMRMVPFETSLALWRTLIARLPAENVGVGVGSFVRIEHYGMVWEFAKHVSNAREFLRGIVRFAPLADSVVIDHPLRLRNVDTQLELHWPAVIKYGMPERIETLNIALLSFMARIAGRDVLPCAVRAAHPVDAKRRLAEQRYGCAVRYDAADDVLCFDRATLDEPFPNAQPQVARAFMELLERKLVPDARLPIVERVRRVIELQAQRGEASQAAVARALGMSVRSLQRELRQEGLRYGDVFAEALKRVATELMQDHARSLEDIAVELGFSDPSSFARTWKRITGESPGRYRARVMRVA
jgi:AraC-like DNA-binding protein